MLKFYSKTIVYALLILSLISLSMLFSASDGSFYPWSYKQFIRLLIGTSVLIACANIKAEFWYENAYLIYLFTLVLLICVEVIGSINMGAQRWINLYFFNLQPSELIRISLIVVLARYFSDNITQIKKTTTLIWPILFVLLPFLLIVKQPDLGTGILILGSASILFLLVGVQFYKFIISGGLIIALCPILWRFLHDYQKKRVLIFMGLEHDPKNSGYHLMQSKIALGSGGIFGKGFMEGTQSHLQFLPEKQTDFIFTLFAEEMGLIACLFLISIYAAIIWHGYHIAYIEKNRFKTFLVAGFISTFFLYVFINIAMVTGLMPIVGVPLPFMSYGGSSLISIMASFGIILSIRREQKMKHAF